MKSRPPPDRLKAEISALSAAVDALASEFSSKDHPALEQDLGKMRDAAGRLTSLAETRLGSQIAGDEMQERRSARHDLRTPVASIIGYGELLAEEAEDDGATALMVPLSEIVASARDLLDQIDAAFRITSDDPAPPDDRTVDAVRDMALAVGTSSKGAKSGAGPVTGRILVVDDNPAMRDLISRRLMRDGHSVQTCDSGVEALELAKSGSFDLMLLDLMMPGISGLDVLRILDDQQGGSLPVIVISALDETAAAVRCIDAGADDFLSKPVDETLLRARITSSLERKFLRDSEQRTLRELEVEQERSEMLLRNVLPASVVERFRAGETVIADSFEDATVLFCDLVGFTAMSARLQPAETLAILNDIFSGFDRLAEEHGLEKIKTIGDAYLAVGGITAPFEDHARRVLSMASKMPAVVASVAGADSLNVRIGADTGPVAAGIIGRQKFFYDVWGDTVNTASRLEEACTPGRIHISKRTRNAAGDTFDYETRPPVALRGKGAMQTFFLA